MADSVRTPTYQYGWQVPTREPTAELYPKSVRGLSGLPGIYDQMERGHPRIASAAEELVLTIARNVPEFRAPDDATAEEQRFTDLCQSLLVDDVTPDADCDATGWAAVAPMLSDYYRRGFYLAERRWVEARTSARPLPIGDGRRVELYQIHASTVDQYQWPQTPGATPIAVRQTSRSGSEVIGWDRLLHLQHGGTPGEVEGVSWYRPLVMLFERWKGALLGAERRLFMDAGMLRVVAPPGESEADRAAMLSTLQSWASGYAPWLIHPEGYQVAVEYPSGSMPDVRSTLEYLDAEIDSKLSRALRSLAAAAHGSRALGEEVAGFDAEETAARLEVLCSQYGRANAAWLAREIGYAGRLPSLELVDDVEVNAETWTSRTTQAVAGGLLTWSGDDEAQAREILGLGERAEQSDARTLLVGQIQAAQAIVQSLNPVEPGVAPIAAETALELLTAAGVPAESAQRIVDAESRKRDGADVTPPTPAPVTMADGHVPPKGAAETAARALEWRREYGRGGTEVGVARARDLSNRKALSLDTVKRMKAYFDRHVGDLDAEGAEDGEPGFPSAGRIAWDLWGGDAGRAWAERVIRRNVEQHEHSSCNHAESEGVTVVGADGREFVTYRPLTEIESDVAWQDNWQAREELDAELTRDINALADRHRADVWDALADGWQPGERAAVYDAAVARYEARIAEYRESMIGLVGQQAADEAARAVARGLSVDASPGAAGALERAASESARRTAAAVQRSAETVASRVQGEVETAWTQGADRASFTTRITPDGLTREARAVGTAIESQGRLLAPTPEGVEVAAVVRTSIPDRSRCTVCKDRDGITFRLPEDEDTWEAWSLPDSQCKGAPNCRCGWLILYGRSAEQAKTTDDEKLARLRREADQ